LSTTADRNDRLQRACDALTAFLARHPRVLVLTGAGISAASGIPTYRDGDGLWRHSAPVQHGQFLRCADVRRRYWLRSWHGWPMIRDAAPNAAHEALAALEYSGAVELLITQNVDRLHQRAGSRRVLDLHGRVDRVRCLACGHPTTREQVQARLSADNGWLRVLAGATRLRPDGDAELSAALARRLIPPRCGNCGGDLIPDVVFFGGNIPRARVAACHAALERASALLAVGSSLQVFSGYRLCRDAHRAGRPVAIINPGSTRADAMATLHLRTPAAPLLAATAAHLAALPGHSGTR